MKSDDYMKSEAIAFVVDAGMDVTANNFYPRATRCGGDIVTLLWFRASVRAWFRPSEDLVNTIETKPLHISLSNLADMFTMMRG